MSFNFKDLFKKGESKKETISSDIGPKVEVDVVPDKDQWLEKYMGLTKYLEYLGIPDNIDRSSRPVDTNAITICSSMTGFIEKFPQLWDKVHYLHGIQIARLPQCELLEVLFGGCTIPFINVGEFTLTSDGSIFAHASAKFSDELKSSLKNPLTRPIETYIRERYAIQHILEEIIKKCKPLDSDIPECEAWITMREKLESLEIPSAILLDYEFIGYLPKDIDDVMVDFIRDSEYKPIDDYQTKYRVVSDDTTRKYFLFRINSENVKLIMTVDRRLYRMKPSVYSRSGITHLDIIDTIYRLNSKNNASKLYNDVHKINIIKNCDSEILKLANDGYILNGRIDINSKMYALYKTQLHGKRYTAIGRSPEPKIIRNEYGPDLVESDVDESNQIILLEDGRIVSTPELSLRNKWFLEELIESV